MEHSFRIAIWMFLLLGFLQARPALDGLINDFGVRLLRNEVSCVNCPGNPLTVMKDGLKRAQKDCTIRNERVDGTLDVLELIQMLYPTVSLDTSCCFLINLKNVLPSTELVFSSDRKYPHTAQVKKQETGRSF
uniref:Uncharacterized protein n=1 Tax=Xiphophorus couchianus TaxID=32473 RepID=A0A3B5MKI1_9TELE